MGHGTQGSGQQVRGTKARDEISATFYLFLSFLKKTNQKNHWKNTSSNYTMPIIWNGDISFATWTTRKQKRSIMFWVLISSDNYKIDKFSIIAVIDWEESFVSNFKSN